MFAKIGSFPLVRFSDPKISMTVFGLLLTFVTFPAKGADQQCYPLDFTNSFRHLVSELPDLKDRLVVYSTHVDMCTQNFRVALRGWESEYGFNVQVDATLVPRDRCLYEVGDIEVDLVMHPLAYIAQLFLLNIPSFIVDTIEYELEDEGSVLIRNFVISEFGVGEGC